MQLCRCCGFVAAVLIGWTALGADRSPVAVEARNGIVVSVSAPGSEVGLAVLKEGGNAVDAAVATAFAMAVTHPEAGNIGGGGFMMIHPGPKASPICIDYRETAPAAASIKMFQLGQSHLGHRMVGVPGTVRGLALAHRRFGVRPWKTLVMPAVKLAQTGFEVDQALASSLNRILRSAGSSRFEELQRVFKPPHGKEWRKGDRLIQNDLAGTLSRIAEEGADGFYGGRTASLIEAEMNAGGGIITKSDLAGYRAKARKPIHSTFRGHDIYGPPPPSSGGITLVLMLNILENFDLRESGRWSPQTLHLMIESMKRAYVERARYLGDSDFVKIPPKLVTKSYAKKLASQIDLQKATPSDKLAGNIVLTAEGENTTHFSVIDRAGMAVSNTYTLEAGYGSRVVVRGAGFLLNNEMGDFNFKPDHTDRKGNIGTQANLIAPGKRMLSSQTPVLVLRNGRVVLVTGSPGGRTIINTSLQMVLNVLEFEMDLPSAVAAHRIHHQWFPDRVRFEGLGLAQFQSLIGDLKQRGHHFESQPRRQGDAHSILVDPKSGRYIGVADRRRSGLAVGF